MCKLCSIYLLLYTRFGDVSESPNSTTSPPKSHDSSVSIIAAGCLSYVSCAKSAACRVDGGRIAWIGTSCAKRGARIESPLSTVHAQYRSKKLATVCMCIIVQYSSTPYCMFYRRPGHDTGPVSQFPFFPLLQYQYRSNSAQNTITRTSGYAGTIKLA